MDEWLFDEYQQNTTLPAPINVYKYETDGSYLQTTESQATKVHYGSCWQWDGSRWVNNCDHSANRITSGPNAGKYESKWGRWGVYIHAYDKCPYTHTNRRFFKKNFTTPTISVPYEFIKNTPIACSSSNWKACYTWSSSQNISISGSGSSVTVTGISDGDGWINIKNGSTVVVNQTIKVGYASYKFRIRNDTPYNLNGVVVDIKAKIGSSPNFTTFGSVNVGNIQNGYQTSFLNMNTNIPPGTAITNFTVVFYTSSLFSPSWNADFICTNGLSGSVPFTMNNSSNVISIPVSQFTAASATFELRIQ